MDVGRAVARLRKAATRAQLRLLVRPIERGDLVRLGSEYGGWWVPRSVLRSDAVAYCAGAGEDISFDLALLQRGLRVTVFDPTPRAIAYVRNHDPGTAGFRFEPVGWWDSEDQLRFYAPRDPSHVSHSVVNLQATSEYFLAPVEPVHSAMVRLGDDHVDLIKMDIEGAEYRVIDSLLAVGPRPHVLCVEFDQPQPTGRTISAIRKLQAAGYALNRIEGWNFTFTSAGV